MLSKLFRTKERIFIAAVILILSVIVVCLYFHYSGGGVSIDQAVMAENYLKAGNYEQSVKAYKKALSMKNIDREFLTICLSDAYVGMNDYDKALEVLRSYYEETSGSKVKVKIEEVTAKKIDYDFDQTVSRAEIYYSNKEYDKAIIEYEKAKKIKSKEVTSYIRITQAYVEKGEYENAREEALEGQELTQDVRFDKLLVTVDSYLTKEQYDTLVDQAVEYINQENYEGGIATYQKAIKLLPQESAAYEGLAEFYILQKEYSKAVILLTPAVKLTESEDLEKLLKEASDLKDTDE